MLSWRQRLRNAQLENSSKDALISKQDEEIKLLKQHVLHLENKLRKYINENTPSSMVPVYLKPVMKSPNRLPVGTNPRVKPKGGKGGTRKIPKKIHKREKVRFTRKQLKLLRKTFNSQEMISFYLDGSTMDRQGVIEGFQGYNDPCVFFMSLKAGGLGLNLTEASYVFLLDPWWNPAVENQAIDRCYRIGQDNPVTVYRFITKDSIEEKVSQLQEIKKVMEKTVISETEIEHVPLTEDRLEQLLEVI